MGLFDNNKRNKHINSLNKQEIENEIIEKKQEISQLKKEIDTTKVEIAKQEKNHTKELKALDEKQVSLKERIDVDKEKLNKELAKLENKQNRYKQNNDARNEEINKKIAELKNKKKKLLSQKLELDKATFDRRKKNIEKQLAELKQVKEKQEADFEAKLALMNENYEKLLQKKKEELNSTATTKEALRVKTETKTNEFQAKEIEVKKKHQETLKKLADEHRDAMNEIKAEEENKLKVKKNELKDLYTETDSLTNLRNSLMKELESVKIRNEHEYETVSTRYDVENTKLLKDNEILRSDLDNKQKRLEEQVASEKAEYDSKLQELEYFFGLLNDKRNATTVDLQKQIDAKNTELKAKYAEYLGALDESYKSEKSKLDEELNVLRYNLSQEEEQLKNRSDFLNERYNNRDAQYRKNVEDYKSQVKEAQANLTVFENECNTRVANFKKDLEKLKNDNVLAIEAQNKHYSSIISDTKKDYSARRKEINENISQTKIDIENVNVEIEKLNKDLEAYKAQYEKKKSTLDKEHASYLNKIASAKADIEKSIASLNDLMKENEEKHAKNLAEVEEKKKEITNTHEAKLAELNSDHSKKINAMNTEHANAIAEAEREHNIKIEKITNKYQKDVNTANNLFAAKQKEYEDEKTKLETDLVELHNDTENKIAELQTQKADILKTIVDLRNDIDAKQIEFDSQVKQIESEHIAKLDEMARTQDEALAKITSDYEEIPNKELSLSIVRADYEAKQKEYNDNAADVALKKHNIDSQYQSVESSMKIEREKADNELAIINREFERVKGDAEKLESDLNNELAKRKQELEDYKDDLAAQAQTVKKQKAAEAEKVSKQLEDEYAAVEKQYADKQAVVSRQYDEEIKAHQADLDTKYDNLNSLINEINQRRDKTEREYIAKYNSVADVTKVVQQELDTLVNQNNLKRSELATALEQKKADNNAEIENIKNNYNNVLNEKKQAYDNYIAEVREKCNNMKKEISDMEKQKEIETSKLETYANEKATAMAILEKETALYIENIKNKMDSISAQQVALESAHSKRVATIKSHIASTMSDYDNLLRTRSEVIANEVGDDSGDLVNKAKSFRERLNALEESHKQILTDLVNKRNETLDKIAGEIEELEATKPDRLQSYEDEITNISLAYDAMLRDEQVKQEKLNVMIGEAKKEQEHIMQSNKAELDMLAKELIDKKHEAAATANDELKNTANEFNELTANLKDEFDKLVNDKKILSKDLASLTNKFARIDEEVLNSTNALKDKYMSELLKVRKAIEEKRIRRQEELSKLDAMSHDVDDIFKRF